MVNYVELFYFGSGKGVGTKNVCTQLSMMKTKQVYVYGKGESLSTIVVAVFILLL